ncbi:MAG: hypothetical protein HY823_10355 [Acidobacteria bacterium]|nr:hypothetical protein [Acidobacteriota bacterium]
MRFLPLVSSREEASRWRAFPDLELLWEGGAGTEWATAVRGGQAVHGLHFRPQEWKAGLLEEVMEALRPGLGTDFLVLPADPPATRWGLSGFLGTLETLLEATAGRGLRLALRAAPGRVPRLLDILREVRGDAVGFCWDETVGESLEAIADRLHCAVGRPGMDARPLQHWGYRWNMAIPGKDPELLLSQVQALRSVHPAVLFPAEMPATALGRPVVEDPEVSLGRPWRGELPG